MSILETLGLDLEALSGIGDPSLFEGTGTTTLRLGKRVPYNGSITGKDANGTPVVTTIPCYVTLQEARLTRLSLLKQQQVSSGKEYWLATGILKPVKMDVELVIDGNTIHLVDFLHTIAQQASGSAMTRDEFVLNARRIGFNFDEGMPLFFQQFGADFEGFSAALDAFKSAGAVDAISDIANPGRINAAYTHSKGVPVTAFELGTVDRTKSPRNQGFLNLVEAQIEQFTRIVGMRKSARLIKARLADKTNAVNENDQKKLTIEADNLEKMSRQWVSSWSGAQQRIVNDNGNYRTENVFDPVNAPCGRFTMLVGDNEVACDLWRNSARANNAEKPAETASTTTVIGAEEPF